MESTLQVDTVISNIMQKLTNMDRRDAPVRNEATHFCETDEGKAAKYDGPCEREIVKVGELPYPWTRSQI